MGEWENGDMGMDETILQLCVAAFLSLPGRPVPYSTPSLPHPHSQSTPQLLCTQPLRYHNNDPSFHPHGHTRGDDSQWKVYMDAIIYEYQVSLSKNLLYIIIIIIE